MPAKSATQRRGTAAAKRGRTARKRASVPRITRVINEGRGNRFGTEDINAYRDTLTGLGIPGAESKKLVARFEELLETLDGRGDLVTAFATGLRDLNRIATGLARRGVVVDPVRIRLAVEVPWAIICQKKGCSWCVSRGWGRPDLLLIGCHPWFGGWHCLYLPVPNGTC